MQTIVTVYLWNTYKVSWINSDNWKCYLHLTTNTSAFHPLHALKTNRHECTQNTDPLSGPTDTTARCNNDAQAESDACEGTFLWAINTQKCWCFPSFLLLFFHIKLSVYLILRPCDYATWMEEMTKAMSTTVWQVFHHYGHMHDWENHVT